MSLVQFNKVKKQANYGFGFAGTKLSKPQYCQLTMVRMLCTQNFKQLGS